MLIHPAGPELVFWHSYVWNNRKANATFFYSQLTGNIRFLQFHQVFIPSRLSVGECPKIPWKVNGVLYPSLGELFHTATKVSHPSSPQSKSCPIIFGLGHAHGANNMISNMMCHRTTVEGFYMWTTRMLDFIPSCWILQDPSITVYFDILYMDLLPKGPETMSVIKEGPHERWNYALH